MKKAMNLKRSSQKTSRAYSLIINKVMHNNWKQTTWGELATLEYGKGLTSYDSAKGDYPVYGTNGLIGWYSKPLFDKAGVIIGRKGAYRGVHYSKIPFFVIDTAFYLKPKTEVDLRWAYYQLLTLDINSMDSGSAIPSTSRPDFYALPVLFPPLPEQRAIAEVLGALDDKIELNRRMNRTLESLAQAVYRHWFVDNKEAPGWEIAKLGEVADVSWGDTNTTKSSYLDEGYPAYSAKGQDGYLPYYDFDRTGIVVSAIGANSGATWLTIGKWSCIKNTLRFWATSEEVSTEYLYYATLGNGKWPLRGSAQPFIAQSDAREMKIIIPPYKLAIKFSQLVSPIIEMKTHNEKESRTLAALRDALLPKLMRGEVRVKA